MRSLLLSLVVFPMTAFFQEAVSTKPLLTLEVAKNIMAAAEENADENKAKVVIAIVDDAGVLIIVTMVMSALAIYFGGGKLIIDKKMSQTAPAQPIQE